MICNNCGWANAEGSKFCVNCGNMFSEQPVNFYYNTSVSVKKKLPIGLIFVPIAFLALVAIVIAIIIFKSFIVKPYEKPVEEIFDLLNDKVDDYDEYTEYLDPECYRELKKYSFYLDEKYNGNDYEAYFNELEEKYGDDLKIKYKITDAKKLDDDEIEEIENDYEEQRENMDENIYYIENYSMTVGDSYISKSERLEYADLCRDTVDGLKAMDIDEGYEIDIEGTIKGDDDDGDFKIKNVIVLLVDDEWILQTNITPKVIMEEAD